MKFIVWQINHVDDATQWHIKCLDLCSSIDWHIKDETANRINAEDDGI